MTKPDISVRKRLLQVLIAVALVFVLLAGRLFYLMVIQSQELQKKAADQWTRDLPITPIRGTIYDTNLNVLAKSASAETVALRPGAIKDANLVADKLSLLLGIDRQTVYTKATAKLSEVWLMRQITKEQAKSIRELALAGVVLVPDTKRYYPMSNLASQVIGYTTIDGLGLEGIEKEYEKYLAGVPGRKITETDRKGNDMPSNGNRYIPPQDGLGVVLTIDSVIQSFAENAVNACIAATNPKKATCIVMDPNTGAILAMVNKPDLDLNNLPRQDMDSLLALSRNSSVLDVYEPGSTFKIFTLAGAIESGRVTTESKFFDPGFRIIDGERISCWRARPHGSQTLEEAVCNSCNPAFMDMALLQGKDGFYDNIQAFGFGDYTKIDYSSDEKGLLMQRKYVRNVDLARMGFGQAIAITPLQLITGASAAVNGGKLMQPYLVKKLIKPDGGLVKEVLPTMVRRAVSEETSATVRSLLESVVSKGSGRNAQVPGYRVGGKTGTAQKYQNGVILHDKHVSSFIGFAPADNPKVIVLLTVDEPSVYVDFGSVVAAPHVQSILKDTLQYLNIPPQTQPSEQTQPTVSIPNVVGMDVDQAVTLLSERGLVVELSGEGKVKAQFPLAQTQVKKNSVIGLVGTLSEEVSSLD